MESLKRPPLHHHHHFPLSLLIIIHNFPLSSTSMSSSDEHEGRREEIVAVAPRTRRKLKHEDVCFECGCSGDLFVCDVCPKVYHLQCSGLKSPDDDFICPWHQCNQCSKDLMTLGPSFSCMCCSQSHCLSCANKLGITYETLYKSNVTDEDAPLACPVPTAGNT